MKTSKESTYFILGMGNIGKILVDRLLQVGVPNEHIMINDTDTSRMDTLAVQFGVVPVDLFDSQIGKADVVILSTPPKVVLEVLHSLEKTLHSGQLIISMAAAVPISRMRSVVPQQIPIVRILPNPPLLVGKGMNPVAFEPSASSEVKIFTNELLEIMGQTIEVDDDQMTWCVGLSGAILRTVFPVLEGMTLAGVEAGLSQKEARRVAATNLSGIAALALETDLSMEQIHSLTPMQTLDEKALSDLFLETARNTRQKVDATQAMLMQN